MKILWTLLDLITIVVLGSGLYLWLRKANSSEAAGKPVGDGLAVTGK
jgi:uncharacterized iron-regulated membrane protein